MTVVDGNVTGLSGVSGTIQYNASKGELTLENASITVGDYDGIYYDAGNLLTIKLIGSNTIDASDYGIYASKNLVITGTGTLIIKSKSQKAIISASESVTFSGGAKLDLYDGKVNCKGISSSAIEINNAEVSAVAHADTIYARNSLLITCGSIVKATATDIDNEGYALYSGGEFKIYGSTVNAVSKYMAAMYSSVDIDVLENSNVTATAKLYSVMANNNITVSGSGLESTAELGTSAACKTLKIANAKGNIIFSAAKNVLSVGAVELDEGYELQGDDTTLTLGKKSFEVSFYVDGEEYVKQTVEYNEKATKPTDPTKTDNNFGGWYRDLTYKLLFDFDTQITTNTDLYASWSAIEKQKEDPTPTNLDPTPTDLDPTPTDLEPTPTNLDPTPTNLDPTPTDLEPTPTDLDPKPYFIPDNARIAPETIATDTACKRDKTCPLSNFKDLDPLFWYHDGIHYCLEQKLMNGIGDDYFSPGGNTTRGMAMTILARMAGIEVDGTGAEWYKKGLDWAVLESISDGTMPEGYITREQFATMLYRYAQKQGQGFKGSWMFLLKYTDRADVSSWANEAVHWCSMNGILDGYGDGSLRPQGLLTRAEAAKMIQAFCEVINQ